MFMVPQDCLIKIVQKLDSFDRWRCFGIPPAKLHIDHQFCKKMTRVFNKMKVGTHWTWVILLKTSSSKLYLYRSFGNIFGQISAEGKRQISDIILRDEVRHIDINRLKVFDILSLRNEEPHIKRKPRPQERLRQKLRELDDSTHGHVRK